MPTAKIGGMSETSGDRLKELREEKGLEIGLLCKRTGWVPSTYRSHENGQTDPIPLKPAKKYADYFGVELVWLLTGEPPKKRGQRGRIEKLLPEIPPNQVDNLIAYMEFLVQSTKR